jgi:hypothetical protein
MFFNQFLPVFSIALTLCVIIGGFVAFRSGFGRQSSEIQDQTINALKVRVETLEGQVESDERELARLRQVLDTVRHALKRRGLSIEIDGEYVTLVDSTTASKVTTRIADTPKVRPLKPKTAPDDDDDAV